jgi:hypothetical protein
MKIISITWAFIFLFLSSGINFHLHLCKGKVSDISLFSEAKSCCDIHDEKLEKKSSCCKSVELAENLAQCSFEKKSCCEDIQINLLISSEQVLNNTEFFNDLGFKILNNFSDFSSLIRKNIFQYTSNANAPPNLRAFFFKKIPILFCSLIFYN